MSTDGLLTMYCVVCGKKFKTTRPEVDRCPEHRKRSAENTEAVEHSGKAQTAGGGEPVPHPEEEGKLLIYGDVFQRIPYGEEDADHVNQPSDYFLPRCPSCGAPRREYHQTGCELEVCPYCGGPLYICDCWVLPLRCPLCGQLWADCDCQDEQ